MLLRQSVPGIDDFLRLGPFLETEGGSADGPSVSGRGVSCHIRNVGVCLLPSRRSLMSGFHESILRLTQRRRFPLHVIPISQIRPKARERKIQSILDVECLIRSGFCQDAPLFKVCVQRCRAFFSGTSRQFVATDGFCDMLTTTLLVPSREVSRELERPSEILLHGGVDSDTRPEVQGVVSDCSDDIRGPNDAPVGTGLLAVFDE